MASRGAVLAGGVGVCKNRKKFEGCMRSRSGGERSPLPGIEHCTTLCSLLLVGSSLSKPS